MCRVVLLVQLLVFLPETGHNTKVRYQPTSRLPNCQKQTDAADFAKIESPVMQKQQQLFSFLFVLHDAL